VHTGSIKFDMHGQPEPTEKIARLRMLLEATGWTPNRPALLAASTHDGEEMAIANVFTQLRARHRDLFLIIVPRHAERAAKIENDLRGTGLGIARRSQLESGADALQTVDALLVDTTGELRAWQYLATIVVIGKSFLATGGQNPAEALMAGKPVLFGPHMENFEALVRMLLSRHGALEVKDFTELAQRVSYLLDKPHEAAKLSKSGLGALQAHEGSTQRSAGILLSAQPNLDD
jgi:3-deoxy-D-manno-octulosonic-acid transferase